MMVLQIVKYFDFESFLALVVDKLDNENPREIRDTAIEVMCPEFSVSDSIRMISRYDYEVDEEDIFMVNLVDAWNETYDETLGKIKPLNQIWLRF